MLPLATRDVCDADPWLELGDLLSLASLEIPELRDAPFGPVTPPELREPERSIFDIIRERDILVHHPFESFGTTVEKFFDTAAEDPNVLAIKLTLYRTSGDTAIVRALTEAAQRGKQVAVLVELQARFDEINNINWARTLESYGVHVAYGLPGLKTHAKTALVVRRDPDGIRRYVHIGTGNYNSRTARLYTDFGLLTCHPDIGADVSELFNLLTGFSRQRDYRRLIVAPATMKDRFLDLIHREAEHARAGRPARIIAKMNALQSPEIINALYDASHEGVEIDLIVRGICCLRPGVPGLSERIRVVSVIGRFLEHSRLFYFLNGGRRGVLHRLSRLDAAQPRTSCRSRDPDHRPRTAPSAGHVDARVPRRQPAGVGPATRRVVRAADAGDGRRSGFAPDADARSVGTGSLGVALHHAGVPHRGPHPGASTRAAPARHQPRQRPSAEDKKEWALRGEGCGGCGGCWRVRTLGYLLSSFPCSFS